MELRAKNIRLATISLKHSYILFNLIDSQREYLSNWIPWVNSIKSISEIKTFIINSEKNYKKGYSLNLGIYYKQILVGIVGLVYIQRINNLAGMWYFIDKSHEGKGIITNACQLLIQYSFTKLKLNRIEIRVGKANLKSQNVAKRLGFKKEGVVREVELINRNYVDHIIYGLLAKDWKNYTYLT